MTTPAAITPERLADAVLFKLRRVPPYVHVSLKAADVAAWIKEGGLESVVCPGTKKALSFAKAWEVVFQERWK